MVQSRFPRSRVLNGGPGASMAIVGLRRPGSGKVGVAMIELGKAEKIADEVKAKLAEHCERIEIAGSVRRRKPFVGDVEIVCIPKRTKAGFRSPSWVLAVMNLGRILKGEPTNGKYVQVLSSVVLDIFTARPDNWGLIFAIRTGSATFSHRLACAWVAAGYKSVAGKLVRRSDKAEIETPEEKDVFALAGMPFIGP